MAAARDRDGALQTARRAQAQIAGASGGSDQARAEARKGILSNLTKAEAGVKVRREELTKARQRSSLQRLVAPEDGTVAQLAVHTLGGVVEPAKPIMVIVPPASQLQLEGKVLNREIGFVRIGQPVAIKLEAFPFTRFDTIPGKLVRIGSDAIDDDRLGLIYPVRVELGRTMAHSGREISLAPGMAATADIRTGRRNLISSLLSPINAARLSAGGER